MGRPQTVALPVSFAQLKWALCAIEPVVSRAQFADVHTRRDTQIHTAKRDTPETHTQRNTQQRDAHGEAQTQRHTHRNTHREMQDALWIWKALSVAHKFCNSNMASLCVVLTCWLDMPWSSPELHRMEKTFSCIALCCMHVLFMLHLHLYWPLVAFAFWGLVMGCALPSRRPSCLLICL